MAIRSAAFSTIGVALIALSMMLFVGGNYLYFSDAWGVKDSLQHWPGILRAVARGIPTVTAIILFSVGRRVVAKGRVGLLWISWDRRRPICLLRSFQDDQSVLHENSGVDRWVSRLTGSMKTLEDALADVLSCGGPLIAIGRPGEYLPPVGFPRIYPSNWQEAAATLIDEAQLTVLILNATPGVLEELALIVDRGALSRLLLVLPDIEEGDARDRWHRIEEYLQSIPGGRSLPAFQPNVRFVWFPSWQETPRFLSLPTGKAPAMRYKKALRSILNPRAIGDPVVLALHFPDLDTSSCPALLAEAVGAVLSGAQRHAPTILTTVSGPQPVVPGQSQNILPSEVLERGHVVARYARRILILTSSPKSLFDSRPWLLDEEYIHRIVIVRPPDAESCMREELAEVLLHRTSGDARCYSLTEVEWVLALFLTKGVLAMDPVRSRPEPGRAVALREYRSSVRQLFEKWMPTSAVLEAVWPGDVSRLRRYATKFERRGMHVQSLDCLRAVSRITGDEDLRIQVARNLLGQGRQRELLAEVPLDSVAQRRGDILLLRAQAWSELDEPEKALDELESAVGAGIDPTLVRAFQGIELFRANRTGEALEALEEVTRKSSYPDFHFYAALARIKSNEQVQRAEADLAVCCQSAPNVLGNYMGRRDMRETMGERALDLLDGWSRESGSNDLSAAREMMLREWDKH